MRITIVAGIFLTAMAYGQSIVTPVFVHKDGEASSSGYSGSEKDIVVDGGAQQVTGWMTFQTRGVDFSKIASAKLTLYVRSITGPGTLRVVPLTSAITAPENGVQLASLPIGASAADSVSLGTADVEKMLQLDVTAIVKDSSLYGVALVSGDGLTASFDAKEGRLAPMIVLTYTIESAAARWLSGEGVPETLIGRDGDHYLERTRGDVYGRTDGVWRKVTNITGPRGQQGEQGIQGIQGPKGDSGAFPSGAHTGDMLYWNGTHWVMIPVGLPGQSLTLLPSTVPCWSFHPGTVTDINGNTYKTVKIGNQEWTVENMRTITLNDGTPITQVTDNTDWLNLSTPGYCWYNSDAGNKEPYGALYNWYTVASGRLAPPGWRVPSDVDWTALENYLMVNGYNYDFTTTGNKAAKSMAARSHWSTHTAAGAIGNDPVKNNTSGFSALPGGYRGLTGAFSSQAATGYWWSASEVGAISASYRTLTHSAATLNKENNSKRWGLSIRLIRDVN